MPVCDSDIVGQVEHEVDDEYDKSCSAQSK